MEELLERYRAKLPTIATLAGLVIAIAAGMAAGLEIGLLTAAGIALFGVILLLWSSLQSLSGDAPLSLDDALSLAAPPAEEEQKRAVLRALKDLEYERGVGKISDEDYAELTVRYRSEAKRLMAQLDESSQAMRERAEALVTKRLAEAKIKPSAVSVAPVEPASDPAATERVAVPELPEDEAETQRAQLPSEPDAATKAEQKAVPAAAVQASSKLLTVDEQDVDRTQRSARLEVPRGPRRRCRACGSRNALSARECANCGTPQAEAGQRLCHACPAIYDAKLRACPECDVSAEAS